MIATFVLASLMTIPTTQSRTSSIRGVDGWQGVHAVTIPSNQPQSVRLARPLKLDLSMGGHAEVALLDGADGCLRLQRHGGRLHGVLRSRVHGNWVIRGDGVTGAARWTALDAAASAPCTQVWAPADDGQEHAADAGGIDMPSSELDGGTGDQGRVIDVLVVCTTKASNNAGSVADMEASVRFWINEANEALHGSRVPTRLRLVGIDQTTYAESGLGFDVHLDRLTNDDDGHLDQVHDRRDETGADLVVLIVGEVTNACGIAWRLDNPSGSAAQRQFNSGFAFSVVADLCADMNYTLAHEIGHNLGCCHNAENAGSCQASSHSPTPFGHRFSGDFNQWRTIMSYNDSFGSFTRIGRFSNPDVFWDGAPSGSSTADNAATITRSRLDAAQYRAAITPATCLGDSDNDEHINVVDLLQLLHDWSPGASSSGPASRSDFNGDVSVDSADLIVLLQEFGPCPS